MIKKKHIAFYKNNKEYAKFLSRVDSDLYNKYIKFLTPSSRDDRVLDVGCGVGTVVNKIASKNRGRIYGIDVANELLKRAKRGKGIYKLYNGRNFPFEDEFFEKVGCFTVMEHVENPVELIKEMIRVLKPNGEIIIGSPNFLRIVGFSATHWRTRGIKNFVKNFFLSLKKYLYCLLFPEKMAFDYMEPRINKKEFYADADAICETNPIDVKFFLRKSGIRIVYQSGLVNYHNSALVNFLSHLPLLRDITGGFFIVGVKK